MSAPVRSSPTKNSRSARPLSMEEREFAISPPMRGRSSAAASPSRPAYTASSSGVIAEPLGVMPPLA